MLMVLNSYRSPPDMDTKYRPGTAVLPMSSTVFSTVKAFIESQIQSRNRFRHGQDPGIGTDLPKVGMADLC